MQRVIERANLSYRRARRREVFFYLGVVAAILNAVFRWPVRWPMGAGLSFVGWVLAVILYSEAYLAVNASAAEVLGRMRDERRAMKCLGLLLLPALLRVFRVLSVLVLS